jgi:hypothetical protein
MYLHIGKDRMVKNDNSAVKEDENFINFYETIKDENKIDISDDNPKTVIITKENEEIKAYITNIISKTLAHRKILN